MAIVTATEVKPGLWRLVDDNNNSTDVEAASEAEARAIVDSVTQLKITMESNETLLRDRADTALTSLQQAYDGWAGLSAAQKDATAKLQLRVVIALVRLVLRKLDSA